MSRIIKCDRCGGEIEEGRIGYVSMMQRSKEGDLCGDNPFENMDFCPECMELIGKFVSNEPATRLQEKTPRAAAGRKKKTEKLKPGPKKVDTGKIRALDDAGWTYDSIADEMGLSTATVQKYLKEE